mmetsp:Transcript_4795/g.7124  ORF Transcript_4795/g.7124 Transcript_4795/m.7124 type:complete len:185 (-) Transcript_4795:142-696(-)
MWSTNWRALGTSLLSTKWRRTCRCLWTNETDTRQPLALETENTTSASSDGAHTLLWTFIWLYVDDASVGTQTVIAHVFVLLVIFERFQKYGLVLRVAKCVFIVQEMKFLGYLVGHGSIKPNPKRLQAVLAMPPAPSLPDSTGLSEKTTLEDPSKNYGLKTAKPLTTRSRPSAAKTSSTSPSIPR